MIIKNQQKVWIRFKCKQRLELSELFSKYNYRWRSGHENTDGYSYLLVYLVTKKMYEYSQKAYISGKQVTLLELILTLDKQNTKK